MAANSDEFKDMLHCSICLELFENPQILKCLHTFCNACLSELKKQGPLKCPTCRKYSRDDEIKKDFNKQNLLDIYNKSEANKEKEANQPKEQAFQPDRPQVNGCQICKKDFIKWGCIECVKLLCETCKEAHRIIPACSSHRLKPVESIANPKRAKLEQTVANLHQAGIRAAKQKQELVQLKNKFEGSKQVALDQIRKAEEEAKREIERHYLSVRQVVELHSLKYVVHVDEVLRKWRAVEDLSKRHYSEICQVVKTNDYLKLIYRTDEACKKVEKDLAKAFTFQTEPDKMPTFPFQQQPMIIKTLALVLDKPQAKAEMTKGMQKLSVKNNSEKALTSTTGGCSTQLDVAPAMPNKAIQNQERKKAIPKSRPSAAVEVKARVTDTLSLKTLQGQSWQIDKQVTAKCIPDQYYHLSCVGNEIWCTVSNRFDIYNTDGDYLRQFQNEAVGNPYDVTQTVGGDLLIAGNQGLFAFNKDEECQGKLCNSRYVNVSPLISPCAEIICGLDKWSKQAVAFQNICHGKWEKCGVIALPEIDDVKDTIKGNFKHLFVCLHSQGVICQHDVKSGSLLKRIGVSEDGISSSGGLKSPFLCHLDVNGWLLVCDSGKKRLALVDAEGSIMRFDLGVEIDPGGVVVDNAGHLWVYHKGIKLLKFQAAIEPEKDHIKDHSLSSAEKEDFLKLI